MPSAAKLVKQASTEAPDPLRQGIIIIEHKIRNLEKRKSKLDSYRTLQSEGKELQPEQLAAVAKYEEVFQSLEFARDLFKQFNTISADTAKAAKKQARKEALEKQANDLSRIKDVLLLQNVLNLIGTDNVREDFLNGQNGAAQLTETDLQLFDNFYETVTPKVFEDATTTIDEQLATAAEHYLNAIDGKSKEFGGVTYAVLKEKVVSVHTCGYFDKPAAESAPEAPAEAAAVPEQNDQPEAPVEEPVAPPEVANPTFQAPQEVAHAVLPPHPIPAQAPVAVPLRPHDVINSVTSGSFHFLQESELDSPDPSAAQPVPIPSAIPTQTFTNQTFAAPPVNPPPASAVPMFHPPPHIQPVHQLPGENFNNANSQPNLPIPQTVLAPVSPPTAGMPYQQQIYSPHADRFDQSRSDHVNDSHPVESSQSEQTNQPAQGQNAVNNKWPSDTDDWNNPSSNDDWHTQHSNQNDWSQSSNNDGGYQTQRSNRDRGDRDQRGGRGKTRPYNGYGGRGRGGSDRGYQNDRQGGGYYNRNNTEGGNFFQNGYNKDGQGGGFRGGRGGMDRPRPNNRGGMDRGGPRGGPRGNSRGRGGGFRGGQSGGQGIPTGGPGPKQ